MPEQNFVLDASIALSWCFKDAANSYADAVQDSLTTARALVPAIWPFEIANVLASSERRQRASLNQTKAWLDLLRALPISIDPESTTKACTDTLELARSQNLSAYDAAYLEVALRRALPLATRDERLRTAAKKIGIKAHLPRLAS